MVARLRKGKSGFAGTSVGARTLRLAAEGRVGWPTTVSCAVRTAALACAAFLVAWAVALACSQSAWAVTAGAFEVTTADGADPAAGDCSYADNVLTIASETPLVVRMAEDGATANADRIVVAPGDGATARLTLAGVRIDLLSAGVDAAALHVQSGSLDLTLAAGSENYLRSGGYHAGLQNGTCALVIDGDGALEAHGGNRGAGIGSAYQSAGGNITVNGGTIGAYAGPFGAGIGGGGGASSGAQFTSAGNFAGRNITINGGTVEAVGASTGLGAGGAGIGGGVGGTGEDITITGGTVTARGAAGGAGIGGGANDANSAIPHAINITVTGGTVTAVGSSYASLSACGIGGGSGFPGGTPSHSGGSLQGLTITGGFVSATFGGGAVAAVGNSGISITGGYFAESGSALPSTDHARGLAGGLEPSEGYATAPSDVDGYLVQVVPQETLPAEGASIEDVTVTNGGVATNDFTYGDTITVQVEANFLGMANARALMPGGAFARAEAAPPQMALFLGDEQISSSVAPDENGVYTLVYDTADKRVQAAGATSRLTARFLGTDSAAAREDVDVTLSNKEVGLSVDYVASTIYNGTTDTYGELSATGTVDGDAIVVDDAAFAWTSPHAGTTTYSIDNVELGSAWDAWYTIEGTPGIQTAPDGVSIRKAPLAVTANDATVAYGDAFTPSVSYDGLVDGEDAVVLDGALEISCDYEPGDPVGTYPITVSGATSDDYEIAYVAGTLTVEPREATLAWTCPDRTVGDGKSASAVVSNAFGADDVSVLVENGESNEPGLHTACATALRGAAAGNYRMPSELESTYDYVVADPNGAVSAGVTVRLGGSDPTTAFVYGDAIEMAVTPDSAIPAGARMALFYEGRQLCDPVEAHDGSFVLGYDTACGLVPVGAVDLVARYVSDEPTADQWTACVTLEPKRVSATIVGIDGGVPTGKAYDGTADANDVAAVRIEGLLAQDEGFVLPAANVMFVSDDPATGGPTAEVGTKGLGAFGLFLAGPQASYYRLESTFCAGEASDGIVPREISFAPELFTKIYDGTTDGALSTLSFDGLVEGEQLRKNVDYRVVSVAFAAPGIFEGQGATVEIELTDSAAACRYALADETVEVTADVVVGPVVAAETIMQRFPDGATVADLTGPTVTNLSGETVSGTLAWYHDDNWGHGQEAASESEELHTGTNALYWFFTPDDGNYARAYGTVVAMVGNGAACPLSSYADLSSAAWYHYSVDWCIERGVMVGYDGTDPKLFGPLDVLTRAQMAAVLYNAAGRPDVDPSGAAAFVDCDPSAWYAKAVAWCGESGVFRGYGDGVGRFGPDDPITREQIAVVLWRAAGAPEGAGWLDYFVDGGEASAWAVDALEWAVGEGVLRGYDGTGELDPAGNLQRAQAAAIVMRADAIEG